MTGRDESERWGGEALSFPAASLHIPTSPYHVTSPGHGDVISPHPPCALGSRAQALARARERECAHARTRTHTHARTRTCTHMHARTCTHMHARTCTHKLREVLSLTLCLCRCLCLSLSHTRTHQHVAISERPGHRHLPPAYTRTHARTHARAHTHTRERPPAGTRSDGRNGSGVPSLSHGAAMTEGCDADGPAAGT